ncbi:MAG: hypothetical protein LBH46_03720, partial [Rickettsiales bacterium]|nr:hypothetical protein [Rickettsiales bacterium]
MLRVCKFGGSILKDVNDVKIISSVISENSISVFSAFFGITDALVKCARVAKAGLIEYEMQLEMLKYFHMKICVELEIETEFVEEYFKKLKKIMDGVFYVDDLSKKILDKIM